METITASILKMIFTTKENSGFKVMVARTQAGKSLTITGEFGPEIIPETVATFHGKYGTHPKFGHQFKAYSYKVTYNAQELASVKIFLDSVADQVGPERSRALIAHFGTDTLNIIENNPERLTEVPGIGKVIANNIVAAWQENRQKWSAEKIIYSLRAFLMSIGLREKRIKRVLDHFGGRESQAEEAIRENPYSLAELEDFGFTTVDFIAKQLGISDESPLRFKAFILYLMEYISPSNGHLFLTVPEVYEAIVKYSTEANTHFLNIPITDFVIFQYAKDLASEGKVIFDEGKIYSKKQYEYETKSASLLAQIANEESDLIFLTKEKVDKFIETFEHEHNWILSEEQKTALYYFVEKKVFVITGLPGSGKTTVLKAVVDLALSLGLNLTCMTPTGISAKKLSGVIQNDAYTIHRKLGFRGNKWMYDEVNQYNTDVAIVDESSMVDQEVFYRLLSALKKRTHLIFVGDHNQLPSVGAGNVLRELINCNQIPVVKLDKIFRQDEASDIIKASHRIIHGDTDLELFKKDPASDIFFMRIQSPQEIEQIIIALATKFKDERREFQIISARNDGPLGINPLNNILQEALNPPAPHLTEVKMINFTVRVGDRVIVKKNDYENEIFNGDIGKVTFIGSGKVLIRIDERLIELSVDEVNEKIKLAYSITIHKSQGLEYETIILPFINQYGKNMLQRNLLYTALTRAKKKIIVLGHGSAIEKAIENTSVTKRNTVLGERIKECLHQKRKPFSLEPPSEPKPSQDAQIKEEPVSLMEEEFCPMDLIEE